MVVLTFVTKKNGETFYFDEPFQKAIFIKLNSCSLYNSWYNLATDGIIKGVRDNGPDFNLLTVPAGHHSHETLVEYFKQDKRVATGAAFTINGGFYFLSHNVKVKFADGFDGLFSSVNTKDQKTWFFGGFKTDSYFIHCSLIDKEENYFNTKKSDLLAKFDVRGKPYEKVFYQAGNEEPFRKCSTDHFFKSISISVKNEDGKLFDFKNMPLEFQSKIK